LGDRGVVSAHGAGLLAKCWCARTPSFGWLWREKRWAEAALAGSTSFIAAMSSGGADDVSEVPHAARAAALLREMIDLRMSRAVRVAPLAASDCPKMRVIDA
jgi:hypothetical protein